MSKMVMAADSDISDLDPQKFKCDAGYAAVESPYDGLLNLEEVPQEEPTSCT